MISILAKEFGKTRDGQIITAFKLKNSQGMIVTILDLGCAIQSIIIPDKDGILQDVVLGYDDVASYEEGTCCYGATVGRFANRIGGASFSLDGKIYQLEKSLGENNHVHGIFPKRHFLGTIKQDKVVFTYLSPSMEEGYPGNLSVEVSFHLTEDNVLEISYIATCDEPTILNLTNHCYFNLNGNDGSTIFNHQLQLNCHYFTEYNDDFSQSGNLISVEKTPLDFLTPHYFKDRWKDDYHQFRICTGYDHNLIIDGQADSLKYVGSCWSEKTGLCLEMQTTEPAIQLYSSNYIQYDRAKFGKKQIRYPKNGAFCLEAQHYPDSPNHQHFPSTVLRPGETYRQLTIYKLKKM